MYEHFIGKPDTIKLQKLQDEFNAAKMLNFQGTKGRI